uniref:Uncharacterized protein n=1 Tax=Micrurus lemniscatus lemniscatus TaxID=129467 RepID=A0A2D4I9H4_MICLE
MEVSNMLTQFIFAVSHALLSKTNGMGDSSSAVAMMPDRCYDSCAIKHHPVIKLTCTHLKAKVRNTLFWLSSISEMAVIQKYSRSFSLKLAFLKFSFQEKNMAAGKNLAKYF